MTPLMWPQGQEPAYVAPLMSDVFGTSMATLLAQRRPEDVLEAMDAAGVGVSILNALPGRVEEIISWVEAYPSRFRLSVELDPRDGMAAVREIRRLHADHALALVRMVPFAVGLAPNHAVYYPLFAACTELGIPVSVTCGMPGPPMPAEVQRPIHLDDVCRYFPDLVLVMAHGADPWWAEAIRMMMRFPNLYLMTSDWSPAHLPPELLRFMAGRGRGKILFATGYPVLDMARCRTSADGLGLDEEVLGCFLGANARDIFGLTPAPLS